MAEKFELKKTKDGQFMFNLKAGNGQIIGNSEMYSSTAVRDNGIESIKTNGPDAPTEDLCQ